MNVDLFLKKVPVIVKDLIAREAAENRRSINQEAIALLEEALRSRVETNYSQRRSALVETLRTYADGKAAGQDTHKRLDSVSPLVTMTSGTRYLRARGEELIDSNQ